MTEFSHFVNALQEQIAKLMIGSLVMQQRLEGNKASMGRIDRSGIGLPMLRLRSIS
jgi:hypothetical protein